MVWTKKKLKEVCELFADGDWIEKKDQSASGIRLVQTGNIGNGLFLDRSAKARYVSEGTFKRLRCTEVLSGDCLLSRLPDPVGRAVLIPDTKEKMITAVDCTIMRFNKDILPEWFIYYSLSPEYQTEINKAVTGATRQRISRSNLGLVKIPVPPVSDQRRLISIFDGIFEKATKAKENAEKNLQNTRELFDSYLQNIFANPGNNWSLKRLEEITTKIGSGATPRGGEKSYKQQGISLIRSLNVHDLGFRRKNLAFLDSNQADKLSNVTIESGDVLLNITGASVARCCVVPDEVLPARVNQHVSIIRLVKTEMLPKFLHYALISKEYKDRLLRTGEKGGSTRQAITKAEIEDFMISFPSPQEQRAIVTKIDDILAETKKLETIYQQKLIDLEELKKSVLHKAFNGELAGACS